MPPFFRMTLTAAAFSILSACEMETATPPMDFEAIRAERITNTLAVVDACRISECGRLDLDRGLLNDFSIVADLTHVTAFMTSFTDFDNLADIAAMTQLRELHIGQTQIADLSGLSNFPNLTLLHAQRIRATDFSAVGQLSRLEELAIGNSDLSDLSFVRGMSRLKTLNIKGSGVTDLSPLAGLRSLESLDMMGMSLPADLSPLLRVPNLKLVSSVDWGDMTPEQQSVIDQLTAKGVEFSIATMMPVC